MTYDISLDALLDVDLKPQMGCGVSGWMILCLPLSPRLDTASVGVGA
jgi:hypothetical protein